MTRPYETVLIFDSSLDESQIEEKIQRFQRILTGDGEATVQSVSWGKRKLAYPIGRREQGTYWVLRYQTAPESLNEFERVARLDEQILRHLTIVNPPEASVGGGQAASAPRESRPEREED